MLQALFHRLNRRGRRPKTPEDLDRYAPVMLGDDPTDNPIQQRLDAAGFPFKETCQNLVDRYGMEPHPAFARDYCPLRPDPLGLEGLIYPLSPQLYNKLYLDQPPLSYSGAFYLSRDPLQNLRHAHDQFARWFGPAELGRNASNSISCGWQAGLARVELTIMTNDPGDHPSLTPTHKRDKRLKTACFMFLLPGHLPALSPQEREGLRHCTVLARTKGTFVASTLQDLFSDPWRLRHGPYLRRPPLDQDNYIGRISLSGDGAALIVCRTQLEIIPIGEVQFIKLQETKPAKGPGGVGLTLECLHAGQPHEIALSGSY